MEDEVVGVCTNHGRVEKCDVNRCHHHHCCPLLFLLLYLLSPLCRVFTIIYLKQTMFLEYIVLQLFCISICATCNIILPMKYVLYYYISTFHSMCAVPNMAVFCSSWMLCFLGMLLRYCLSDFWMVPVAPIVTGLLLLLLLSLLFHYYYYYYIHMYVTTDQYYIHAVLHQNMVTVETKWTNAWCWTLFFIFSSCLTESKLYLSYTNYSLAQSMSHREYGLPQPLW